MAMVPHLLRSKTMSKKSELKRLAAMALAGQTVAGATQDAPDVNPAEQLAPQAEAPKAATAMTLVLGPKAPKHRVGHNSAAWAVITPMLPASATALADAVGKVPNIGGPKGNGMLYVSYAIRRGWLAKQA